VSVGYEVLPGGAALEEMLTNLSDRAADFTPAFEVVVESFRRLEQKRFADNGPGWPPLADSTMNPQNYGMPASWARGNQNADQILQDSGALLSSLEGGVGSYVLMTPFSVEMGTTVPYAHWHQTGGTRLHASGAGWPPQRKIVEMTAEQAVEWSGIIMDYLFVFLGAREMASSY
jgi:phage gpG-like protein